MTEEQNNSQDHNQPADTNESNHVDGAAPEQTSGETNTYTHDGNAYGEPGVIPSAPVPPAPVPPAPQAPAQPQQPQATPQQPVPPAPQQYYDHNGYPAPAPEQQVPADQAPAQPQQPVQPQQPGQPYPPQQGQPNQQQQQQGWNQQGQPYQQPQQPGQQGWNQQPQQPGQQGQQQGWNQQQPYQGDPNDFTDPNNPYNPNNPNSPYAQQPGCLNFGGGSQAGVGYDPNLKLTPLNKVVWIVIGFVCNFFGVLLAWLFGMTMPAQVRYQIVKYACIGFFIEFFLLMIFGYFGGGEMLNGFMSGDGGASTAAPSGGESAGSGGSGGSGSGSSAWG